MYTFKISYKMTNARIIIKRIGSLAPTKSPEVASVQLYRSASKLLNRIFVFPTT